ILRLPAAQWMWRATLAACELAQKVRTSLFGFVSEKHPSWPIKSPAPIEKSKITQHKTQNLRHNRT
ncbi:MAG: hypothetical protein ACFN1C_04575, partial [Rothia mucilaginosa]